jgi:cell division septation protein DedD
MHTPDDGFHEIQLNGKQLVFLFMAATVVSVVIFLCGVLVGRGVRAEQSSAAETAALAEVPTADVHPPASPAAPLPESDPTVAQAPPAVDELSYFDRLENPQTPKEELKPQPRREEPRVQVAKPLPTVAPAREAAPARVAVATVSRQPAPPPAQRASAPAPATAGGSGYAVQLAALNSRGEADALARRLSSKGYSAYVLAPGGGAPAVFRVRVGTFDTRREAEGVADRLQKEEQFKPWVTR